jgi:hypothetical protein
VFIDGTVWKKGPILIEHSLDYSAREYSHMIGAPTQEAMRNYEWQAAGRTHLLFCRRTLAVCGFARSLGPLE